MADLGYLSAVGDTANRLFQIVNDRYRRRRGMLFAANAPLAA